MSSLESILSTAKTGAKINGHLMQTPSSQWEASFLGLTKTRELLMAGLDEFLVSDARKTELTEQLLPQLISRRDINCIAMVLPAWQIVTTAQLAKDSYLNPTTDPNRTEVLEIVALDKFSMVTEVAEVHRSEDAPPTLGEWKRTSKSPLHHRFVAIRRALTPQG